MPVIRTGIAPRFSLATSLGTPGSCGRLSAGRPCPLCPVAPCRPVRARPALPCSTPEVRHAAGIGIVHPPRVHPRRPAIADRARLDRGALVAPALRRRRPADRRRLVQGARTRSAGTCTTTRSRTSSSRSRSRRSTSGSTCRPAEDARLRPDRRRRELPGQGGQEPAGRLLPRRGLPDQPGLRPADLRDEPRAARSSPTATTTWPPASSS